jgi:CBS domain-containing protein
MRRLGLSLEQAVKEAIPLRDASCMAPDQTVQDAARSMTDVPVLVVRPHDRRHLLGIATAFDLL